MASRFCSGLVGALERPATRRLALLWLAASMTATLAFVAAKLLAIASIVATELGAGQLRADVTVLAAFGWLWSDLVTAVIVGGMVALLAGGFQGRRGGPLGLAILVVLELGLAAAVLVCVELYELFGATPTWQLLGSLSDPDNATDSVSALLTTGRIVLFVALAIVLAAGTPLLWRWLAQRSRLARRAAIGLALAGALAAVGAIAGDRDRFELWRNPVHTFARSALLGQSLEDARTGDENFDAVLAPIAAREDRAADLAPYRALRDWAGARAKPNVVVVVLETMAVDHMGLMGGPVDNTPTLAALAERGLVWSRHYAHTPSSMFSLYAIVCGNHGRPQGIHISKTRPRIDCKSMSELLAGQGYRAGLFHSGRNSYSSKDLFFAGRDYEVAYDTQTMPHRERYREMGWGIEEAASLDAMLAWVKEDRETPFFITYVPVYPHHPYQVPDDKYAKFPGKGDVGRYRNAIYYIDQIVGELLAGLDAQGRLDDTLFLFVGDHGEGFGEHPGSKLHGPKLYDEAIHTFAMWYAPGALDAAARDPRAFGHVDLLPTLLDLLGLDLRPEHPGRSALAPGPRPMVPLYTGYGHPLVGFVDGPFKFIHDRRSGRSELYDLAADPGETRSLASEHPDRVAAYEERAARFVATQEVWEEALPDLAQRRIEFAGTDQSWTAEPEHCEFPASHFAAADDTLRMLGPGEKSVRCRLSLPERAGAVTGFTVHGAEAYNGSFITAMAVWKKGDARREVAHCNLNGNTKKPDRECQAELIPESSLLGGGGELIVEIRYVNREKQPAFDHFGVENIVVDYRLRE